MALGIVIPCEPRRRRPKLARDPAIDQGKIEMAVVVEIGEDRAETGAAPGGGRQTSGGRAIREHAVPLNKHWFAYKSSDADAQAFLAEHLGRELGLAFSPSDIAREAAGPHVGDCFNGNWAGQPALISTLFPFASLFFGRWTSRTPLLNLALTWSASTPGGSAMLRLNAPSQRSE